MNIEEYETRIPKENFDYFNQLNIDLKEKYLDLMIKYYNLVLEFLDKKYNLKEIDEKISKSPLRYKEVDNKDCDIYQKIAKNKYKFFYLRSNIYIERLSKEELHFLNNIKKYDGKVTEFVQNTIKKVATEAGLEKSFENINYGPDSINYIGSTSDVIIGFRENEFYKYDGQTNEEWNELNNKKKYEIRNYLNELQMKLHNKDGIDYKIIIYNDFSVKPINKIETIKM